MFTKIQRVEPLRIITLGEAKHQLNMIDFEDDDTHIGSLIDVASAMCEKHGEFKKLYSTCTVTGEFEACNRSMFLPYHPVTSVTSLKTSDDTDVEYTFSSISERLTITDPNVVLSETLTIVYTAGFKQDEIPEMVKQAVKIIVSDLYNNRESVIKDKVTEATFNALRLLG